MSLKDFEILSKLGSGSYSSVYKVRRRADNHLYALKQVSLGTLAAREKANAVNEVRILASVSNPCVVAYYEAFLDYSSGSLCIVMEYAAGGDLLERIKQCRKLDLRLTEQEIWRAFGEMVQGLCALHEMQILHRDIKSANVFLTSTGGAKLGDLNVAKVAQAGLHNTQTGTPYYASPEVWKDQPYDFKSDIWSLGCVLYEMAALEPPFTAKDMDSLYRKVVKGVYAPLPDSYSPDLSIMIRNLLQVNPISRPTSKRLLQLLTRGGHIAPSPYTPTLLLKTIHFPKNLHDLDQAFPSPKYHSGAARQHLHNMSFDKREVSSRNKSLSQRSESTRPRERRMSQLKESIGLKLPAAFRLPPIRHSKDHM